MKYKLHIAYRNRVDLLRDAVNSTSDIGNLHLWPNNGAELVPDLPGVVHELPALSPVSVINMMIQSSWDDDVMFWAHNDCFAHPNAAADFKAATEALYATDKKWGVHWSIYDILCAFNMKAVREVGYWDPMFFQYTADAEYYMRMTKAGYSQEQWAPGRDGRVEHRGSMTVRSDQVFNHATQWRERTKFDKSYYAMKWGGAPGGERFATPFEDFHPKAGPLAW